MARRFPLMSSPQATTQKRKFISERLNLIAFALGVFSFTLDPLFVYISRDCGSTSICMDTKLGIIFAIARTLGDFSFVCTKSLIAKLPTSDDSRRLDVASEAMHCRWNNLNSTFLVDLAATAPLPQILIWHITHTPSTSMSSNASNTISIVLGLQFSFRAIAMTDLTKNTIKMIEIMMKNAWTGAMLNLAYFMIGSHIWGAMYYDMYISKLIECKTIVSKTNTDPATLNWDQLLAVCTKHGQFETGMFSDAFSTNIVTRSSTQQYVYCLSWGLKSLSSFGQIFNASSYAVDTIFSFLTVIFGLILFGDLLARMQSGLQSTEARESSHRTKQRMAEEWMSYHQLPHDLKKQVKQAIQSGWSATRGINDEAIMDSLPWDVKCEVRRHLYLDIVHSLPPFADMDNHLVSEMCGHMRTFSVNEGTFVAFEGEPVRQMIFIYTGELEVSYANSGRHSVTLGPGEFCGQELLEWCSFPTRSTENLPSSTQTVKCITDVDAFTLAADDVKLLAIQFHRDGKFRQAFQRYAA